MNSKRCIICQNLHNNQNKNNNARNKFSLIYLFVEFSCLTQEFLVIVKNLSHYLAIILSNFREIDWSANILRFFFNGISNG